MNKKPPVVTLIVVGLCLVVFAMQSASRILYGRDVLFILFAKNNDAIRSGEMWRLLTANFLHANLLHLGFNLWGMWLIGKWLERGMGPSQSIGLYLGSGLCGMAASFQFEPYMAAGSSTMVFGLWGAMLLSIYRSTKWRAKTSILIINAVLIVGSLLLSFFLPFDMYGHLGGLFFGILYTILFCHSDVW